MFVLPPPANLSLGIIVPDLFGTNSSGPFSPTSEAFPTGGRPPFAKLSIGKPPVGKPSIVGEKGPELFVPKTSGTVIPNDKLGGGGSTNISVNVDASGSSVQGNNENGKELGRLISVAIQSELLKQRRPGGLLR